MKLTILEGRILVVGFFFVLFTDPTRTHHKQKSNNRISESLTHIHDGQIKWYKYIDRNREKRASTGNTFQTSSFTVSPGTNIQIDRNVKQTRQHSEWGKKVIVY